MDNTTTRTPALTLYTDGSIEAPGVKTYGELLARLGVCAQIAANIQQQLAATPLPVAPPAEPAAPVAL